MPKRGVYGAVRFQGGKHQHRKKAIFTAWMTLGGGGQKSVPNFGPDFFPKKKRVLFYLGDALRGKRKKSTLKKYWAENMPKKWVYGAVRFQGKNTSTEKKIIFTAWTTFVCGRKKTCKIFPAGIFSPKNRVCRTVLARIDATKKPNTEPRKIL